MPHRHSLEKQWTVLELIRWGTDYFRQKDIESPRLNMELLLCHVLHSSRIQLYADFERPLGKDDLATLRELVTRRAHHEPLQYIVGKSEFYSLSFYVDPSVLIPRPETEHLVEQVIKWCRGQAQPAFKCLDIGTGSGCIPIAITHHVPTTQWLAVDRSETALEIARRNAAEHGVADRFSWEHLNFLTDQIAGRFNLITMNPPYIPLVEVPSLQDEVRDYEPHLALTDDADGLRFYRRLAEVADQLLEPGGLIACELGWGQHDVATTLWPEGWKVKIVNDLSDIPRVLLVERPAVTIE